MRDLFSKCYEAQKQDELRQRGVYPYFRCLESGQGSVVYIDGKRIIMLGSNNYLGLTSNPELAEAAIDAIHQYGTGVAGSRFLNGTITLHTALEKELAEYLHKEACLVFPSGFQTNLGIISGIAGLADYIIIDREVHASIYDGCQLSGAKVLRFFHNDVKDLEKKLQSIPETAGCLVIVDGVYSMSGDLADLPGICKMAKKYGARVMVDDSHSIGVLGEGGRGTESYYGLENQVDILMGTLSKALGSLGGYMCAEAKVIDYVKHKSRPFIFSTANAPADTAAALAGVRHMKEHSEDRERLFILVKFFREELIKRNVKIKEGKSSIVPIYTYETERTLRVCQKIFDAGVYVGSVLAPAVPEGQCMLRTAVMATHTPELLSEAAEIIATVLHEEGV